METAAFRAPLQPEAAIGSAKLHHGDAGASGLQDLEGDLSAIRREEEIFREKGLEFPVELCGQPAQHQKRGGSLSGGADDPCRVDF